MFPWNISQIHSRKPRETVDWLSGLEVRVAVKRAMGQQGPPCLVWERGKEKCVTCHRLHNTYIYCERQVCRSYDLPTAFYILWAVLTLEGAVARWKHVFYACQHWRMNALLDHRAKKKTPARRSANKAKSSWLQVASLLTSYINLQWHDCIVIQQCRQLLSQVLTTTSSKMSVTGSFIGWLSIGNTQRNVK